MGKTSMALAVLDRIRDANTGWALEVDLSRGPIITSGQLADRLADQARAARVRIEPVGESSWRGVRKLVEVAATPALQQAAQLLGIDELGDAGHVAAVVDESLAPLDDTALDLRSVLHAIQAATIAADRPAVVFLDEIQRLRTDWSACDDSRRAQESLAEIMEQPDGRVVLLVAGSERTTIEELMAQGEPLHHDGMSFPVPAISDADWHHDLPLRFAEVSLRVNRDHIVQILKASDGHPQRTMRICAHIQHLADGDLFEITEVLITKAIATAQSHPSWSD